MSGFLPRPPVRSVDVTRTPEPEQRIAELEREKLESAAMADQMRGEIAELERRLAAAEKAVTDILVSQEDGSVEEAHTITVSSCPAPSRLTR